MARIVDSAQAVLGGLPINAPEYRIPDSQPFLEAITVLRHAVRIARTIAEVALVKKHGPVLRAGMETIRSLSGKAWEDRPIVLRQIEQIGEKSIKVLTQNNIKTLAALRKVTPSQLELLLNRRPPFGDQVLSTVSELPQYCLSVLDSFVQSSGKNKPIVVELTIECKLSEDTNKTRKNTKHRFASLGMTSILTLTNELAFVDFRRIPTKALRDPKKFSVTVAFTKPSQFIVITTSPDNFAGLSVTETYKPSISAENYPVLDTKPLGYDVDEILAGLEDDPTFWQATLDESDEVSPSCQESNAATHTDIHMTEKASVVDDQNKALKKSTEISRKPKPSQLPNGNYDCRDGLPNPPRRSTGSASQMNQTLLKPQPKLQKTSNRDKKTCEASKAKPTSVSIDNLIRSEKQPRNFDNTQNLGGIDPVELSLMDEEDFDFPDLGDILKEAVSQTQDQDQSTILESTPGCSPKTLSQRKRTSVFVTPPYKQVKRRKLDVTPLGIDLELPLFLPSSPQRDETNDIVFDEEHNVRSGLANENAVPKNSSRADNEQTHLLEDDYAKGVAELFAWLAEVAE
ncbi:hypothetical protein Clacol_006582 [Clathrus columnatus]|uniref:SEC63 domain-containing protein n=1 Tax=Clathrus columnatus TaxID=1419009 RepID=A0AAV5AH99_9AGAM|nr:hypothetical protein Clacol_006582 [Clathrus columnatus]